jgi:AraC-like DNA-binding protein
MEFVNDQIFLEIKKNKNVNASFSLIDERENSIFIEYNLLASDCFFDLNNDNYSVFITINKVYFEKYTENFEIFIQKQSVCCNTQSKLYEIINCNFTGIQRKIFLESAVLYLLFQLQKNPFVFQLNCDTCAIVNKPLEVEKIENARDFIIKNLSENITIPMIANKVGTNQCYLKKGFRELYGLTIFEFIQENRMTRAKFLLEKGEISVAAIGLLVGYSSASSFSQAYKHYFGINPSQYSKQVFSEN